MPSLTLCYLLHYAISYTMPSLPTHIQLPLLELHHPHMYYLISEMLDISPIFNLFISSSL